MEEKKIIVASILVVIVAIVVWAFWISPKSEHRVVIGEWQQVPLEVNGVQYIFTKEGNILGIVPWGENHYPRNALLSPKEGETYQWLGIEITIVEVHINRYVLNIKAKD